MNDETSINEDEMPVKRRAGRRLAGPLEAAWFAAQERLIWPLQDRFALLPGAARGKSLALLGGGGAMLAAAVIVAVLVLSSGGGSSTPTTTVTEAAAPRQQLVAPAPTAPKPKKEKEVPRETLHGAAPVFSPPSSGNKGADQTGKSKATEKDAATSGAAAAGSAAEPSSSSPASARISSNPKSSKAQTDEGAAASGGSATAAAVPAGPPAPPAALKVARRFAQGFVVYETGGDAAAFRGAFEASATPELTKALLQRPPKQPAKVKVPRAKVLNVVAGPSQGSVYKVSVSLLRVGVTSELRLDMERIKAAGGTAGESGKRAEWRVTNVLG